MATVLDESNYLKLSLAVEVLRSVGEARLAVGGASMLPSIWPGDILEIRRAAAADLSLGDIVVFARDNRLVVHRVLRVNRERDELVLITRGDRSHRADAAVSFRELLGKVKAIQRGQRNIAPRLTWWRQIASWILLRSELCTRVLLHLAVIRRNSLTPEPL
jgi:signal peptidase I